MNSLNNDKLKEQLEYYFSDANFARDKFLNVTAEENDGVIPFEALLTFNRLKEMKATEESVKTALKDSKIVTLTEKGVKKVITDEFLLYKSTVDHEDKMVYIQGFPKSYTLENIKEILVDPKPIRIIRRKNLEKEFTGNCLVEYATSDDAIIMLESDLFITTNTGEVDSKIDESNSKEDESKRVKKSKSIQAEEKKKLVVISKKDFNQIKSRENQTENKKENKLKADFVRKLFRMENCPEEITIKEAREKISNSAFVDLKAKIVRMKYEQDQDEIEFGDIKLKKLGEEEASAYFDSLDIKFPQKSTKKKFSSDKKGKRNYKKWKTDEDKPTSTTQENKEEK